MRLLRVDYANSPSSLDLHPLVTVVNGLSEVERRELLARIRDIASGRESGLRGLVLAGGELVELSGFGHRSGRRSTEVDPVVTERRRSLDDTPSADERIQLALIEEARSRLSTGSLADVLALRASLRAAERRDSDGSVGEVTASIQSEPVVAEATVSMRPSVDPAAAFDEGTYRTVGEAFVVVQGIPRTNRVQPAPIAELQRRWSEFDARWAQCQQRVDELRNDLERKEAAAAASEQALQSAEDVARPDLLSPKQEQRLEELAEKAEGRSRRWRRSGQLSEREQKEFDSLLAAVRVQSWTEYSVFRLAPTVSDEKQSAVDEARSANAVAEAEVEEARRALNEDPTVAELEVERAEIRQAASHYLGALMPADLGEALLALGQDELNPDWAGSVTELCRVLDQAQLEPDLPTDHSDDARSDFERTADQILDWTRQWLADQERAMAHPQDLNTESAAMVEPGAAHARQSFDNVDDLRSALADAEDRLVRHQRALSTLMAAGPVGDDSAGQPTGVEVSSDGELRAESMGERLTQVVSAAIAEAGESLPILVDIDFEVFDHDSGRQLFDQCLELAEQAQIIVLSTNEAVGSWARDAGPQAASYVEQTSIHI